MGVRFYYNKPDNYQVINADIIYPLTEDASFNSLNFRISASQSF